MNGIMLVAAKTTILTARGDFMIAAFIVAIGYIGSLKIKAGVNQTSVSRGVGVASK